MEKVIAIILFLAILLSIFTHGFTKPIVIPRSLEETNITYTPRFTEETKHVLKLNEFMDCGEKDKVKIMVIIDMFWEENKLIIPILRELEKEFGERMLVEYFYAVPLGCEECMEMSKYAKCAREFGKEEKFLECWMVKHWDEKLNANESVQECMKDLSLDKKEMDECLEGMGLTSDMRILSTYSITRTPTMIINCNKMLVGVHKSDFLKRILRDTLGD